MMSSPKRPLPPHPAAAVGGVRKEVNLDIGSEFNSLFKSIKSGVQTGVKTAVKAGESFLHAFRKYTIESPSMSLLFLLLQAKTLEYDSVWNLIPETLVTINGKMR